MGNDRRRHGNNQPPYQRTCNHEQPHRPGQAVQNHQTALWANGLAFFRGSRAYIKAFEQTAKKYGIDFALKKDSTETPPRYLVFFKGRDADALTAAFKEFSAKKLTQEQKRQAYIKKKIRDKENQAKREEEQSNFGAEENTVWDRLEVQNEELVAAVQQLKPKARFIVTGYVLKGKTFKELAQETKLTERAAASTYYRSIEKLRIKMEKEK